MDRMDDDDRAGPSSFEEILRQISDEVARSAERLSDLDVDDLVEKVGDTIREQVDRVARVVEGAAGGSFSSGGEPSPLDLPTDTQGTALAALDSGRWVVEPDMRSITVQGGGPGPADALGVILELRVRDWLTADGELTTAGRRALERWLERR
jgi:hypothetical protein